MWGLEVCANSYASAIAGQMGGAIRIELCDNLAEGGTTPSYAQIKECKKHLNIPFYPIIRPRGGDFLYSDSEFNIMKEDISTCRSLQCDGVVFGILKSNGEVDKDRCEELLALSSPMNATFHKAFDQTKDLFQALEDIIDLGFERILSSGAAETALKGTSLLTKLIKQANGRIVIMPGGGIDPDNLDTIIEMTGAREFHASAKELITTKMHFLTDGVNAYNNYELTSAAKVEKLVEIIKNHESKALLA